MKMFFTIFAAFLLMGAITGCGDAKTTIIEKASIPGEDDDHNHGGGTPNGESVGRLLIYNGSDLNAQVIDLADNDVLATLNLDAAPSAIPSSGGFRYAMLVERNADKVGFIDGGLWEEPHDDHFDLFQTTPEMSDVSLSGSRPTHVVGHDGQVAVFFDGNGDAGINASVQVMTDEMIEKNESPYTLDYAVAMHGVAEPRGDHLLSTIRRDDSVTSSGNFILPDQVGVYHLHEGEYELEQTLEVECPDLHGAAQNETTVVFGCGDGLLVATEGDNHEYTAQKLLNSSDVDAALRIGSVWGHHASEQFIGMANSRTSDLIQFFSIDTAENEMTLIEWQPMANAKPVARAFTFGAEQFVILDDQGYLTVIEPHMENGHMHWEYGTRLDITDEDPAMMPDGMRFTLAVSEGGHTAYVADPIAQHVLVIDLELMQVTGDIELDYSPASVTWLGVAEEQDHDHDH